MTSDHLVVTAAGVWVIGAVAMALADGLPLAAFGVLCTGIGQMAAINVMYSLFMLQLPSWIRGRASSVVMLSVWTGMSIGAVVWGAVADGRGFTTTLVVAAVVHLLASSALAHRLRLHAPPTADADTDT